MSQWNHAWLLEKKQTKGKHKVSDKAAMLPFLEELVLLRTTVEELSTQALVLSQSLFPCTKECSVSAFLLPQLRSSPGNETHCVQIPFKID